eukprot:2190171-Alexandrium_andersonii.AAC.1
MSWLSVPNVACHDLVRHVRICCCMPRHLLVNVGARGIVCWLRSFALLRAFRVLVAVIRSASGVPFLPGGGAAARYKNLALVLACVH